jgi:hypothetical protein
LKNKNCITIQDFSPHLFWDVSISDIDLNKNIDYIIKKVLIYGFYSDWQLIFKLYGKDIIASCAKNIRELDLKTAHFISVITDTPINEFKCNTIIRSTPQHWNF